MIMLMDETKPIPIPYSIGEFVVTPFLTGTILSIIDGDEKGWQSNWYYLINWSQTRKPHIVRQDEILFTKPAFK